MFKVVLQSVVSDTGIVTERNTKTSLITLFSAILGAVVGIMNLSILFMVKTEIVIDRVKKNIYMKKKLCELIKNREILELKDRLDKKHSFVGHITKKSKIHPEVNC